MRKILRGFILLQIKEENIKKKKKKIGENDFNRILFFLSFFIIVLVLRRNVGQITTVRITEDTKPGLKIHAVSLNETRITHM